MDTCTIKHVLIILLFRNVHGARKGHMYLSDAMAGITCLEFDRKFSTRSPDAIACVFRCQMVPRCGGASFDPATGQCHGCKCPVFRQDLNDLISVSGAVFYQIPPESLFDGKCGDAPSGAVTAEYYIGTSYTTSTDPGVQLHADVSWAPDRNESYYLKINFGGKRRVHVLKTQARMNGATLEYITQYSVYKSLNCEDKEYVQTMTISREMDASTVAGQDLDVPVLAKCIYLKPETWVNYPSLRLDVLGY